MRTKDMVNVNLLRAAEDTIGVIWSPWYPLNEDEVAFRAPNQFGIYIIRKVGGTLIPRLQGGSDILYIGRSGNTKNRTIRQRLSELLRGHHIAAPRVIRLRKELAFRLEFSFAETKEPESSEKLLLMLYEKEHYELPPLNHVGGL